MWVARPRTPGLFEAHREFGGDREDAARRISALSRMEFVMFQFLILTQAGCRRMFPRQLLHRITTLAFFAIIALFAQTICTQSANADQPLRPNIVLIMADDMGYECVGANGGETYKTPHLDRLAASGMRFEHCHSQPICTPSRVQIMTGIYNKRNYLQFGLLDPRATTFGHLMKQTGYRTCVAGKWQLKGGFDGPKNFGFDEYSLWQLTRLPGRYPNPGLEVNGMEIDYGNGTYGPDIVSDYICRFMQRHKEESFFVYYPMILPHWPFIPTPDSEEWNPTATGEKGRQHWKNRFFVDMVAYTDKIVGKIDTKLAELGIRDNTLLIFTGDNGTYTGVTSRFQGRDYPGGKGKTTDNGTHVPLIVSWPKVIKKSRVSQDLIDFSDMLPTIVEAAGGTVPKELMIDGRSFLPQLQGQTGNPREWIYCWYSRNGGEEGSEHARDQQYKLYANGKFFNIVKDFEETSPLDLKQLNNEQQTAYEKLSRGLARYEKTPRPKQSQKGKLKKANPKQPKKTEKKFQAKAGNQTLVCPLP